MQFSFRTLATFSALLCFRPGVYRGLLAGCAAVDMGALNTLVQQVSRRSAVLFLALGMMFYRARPAPPSSTRWALSSGFVVGCFGLAASGFGEWLNGHAGPWILLVAGVEFALGLGFTQTRRVALEGTETTV